MARRGSLAAGATASVRGGAGFSGFAAGKAGLRMVAESLARELGPKNIHVAHVIVDGAIDVHPGTTEIIFNALNRFMVQS